MNEIEKLYKNAELSNMWVEEYDDKQIWHKSYNKMVESMMKVNDWSRKIAVEVAKKECRKALPPFTAEKQLEIVKMILFSTWWLNLKRLQFSEKFDEGLAQMINDLWQDLTEEEKEQIRSVLNANI